MPKNWKTYKLGDLIGVNINSIRKGDLDWICYVDIKSVGTGIYDEPLRLSFDEAPSRARRLLNEGDTVISSVRPNLKSFFYAQNLEPNTVASTGFAVLSPNKIDSRFLYYLTTNDVYINYLVMSCTGSAYPAFGPKVILESEVTIPESLPEQKSIAAILSSLDDKIELNLQTNKTLEEMAMTLYKHWFVDFGPFLPPEKGGKGGCKFIDSELGQIPEGWEVKRLEEILNFVVDNRGKTAPVSESGIPLIATNCVKNDRIFPSYDKVRFIDDDTFKNWFRAHPLPGDILFVNKGAPGSVNLVPNPIDFCIAQDMIALRVNPDLLSNYYLFLYFRQRHVQFEIKNKSVGTTIPHLKKTDLLKFTVLIPQIEQTNEFTKRIASHFEQMNQNRLENQTLTALRDTLLPKLISGEVRVKDAEQTLKEVL